MNQAVGKRSPMLNIGRRIALAVSAGVVAVTAVATSAAAAPVPVPTNKCTAGYLCLYKEAYFTGGGNAYNSVTDTGCIALGVSYKDIESIINRTNSIWTVYDNYGCDQFDAIGTIWAYTANDQINLEVVGRRARAVKKNS